MAWRPAGPGGATEERCYAPGMGQGHMGGALNHSVPAAGSLSRYRVVALFTLTTIFVAIKAVGHDYWAVGFGLAVLGLILLTPETSGQREPWRQHALRIVSACFVVVTLASIWTTLATGLR
jgi:glucose dehydrogenase